MSLIDELDKSLETIGEIADLLEAQMGRCERGRMPLVTWVTSRFHSPMSWRRLLVICLDCHLSYAWITPPRFTRSSTAKPFGEW